MVVSDRQERAIFDAIRKGTAPPVVKRQASRGTIPAPADELLEILVFLTGDSDPTCREAAKQTLANWSAEKIASLLAHPSMSSEVQLYFSLEEHLPPAVLSALLSHPKPSEAALAALGKRLPVEQIQQALDSNPPPEKLAHFVEAALQREDLPPDLRIRLESLLTPTDAETVAEETEFVAPEVGHAGEKETRSPAEKRTRIALTQKIARMSVAERIHLALTGTKEERLVLVRDPSKEVYRSVLRSQKLSDYEVETIASMNNVAEEVLRLVAVDRKYIKNYMVVRNLVFNPRTPIDISLSFLSRLTEHDLKHLTKNRNVPDTIRSLATRLWKQKSSTRAGAREGGFERL